MWICDFKNCNRPPVRTEGDCIICDCHLCAVHLDQRYHNCPKWEDEKLYVPAARQAEEKEITTLLSKVNVAALLSRASDLRDGVHCVLSKELQYDRSSRSSVMGGMNYHIELQFEDGPIWLARVRRVNATSPPPDLRRYIISSEAATLKFLSTTKVPVPQIFDLNLDKNNPVGVEYILFEKMPGKEKIIRQLADIFVELQAHPFDTMGSLDQLGSSHIGPFAREECTDYVGSQMRPMGPFTTSFEFLRANIQLTMDLIKRGERYANRPIDGFLIHRFLLDSIPRLLSQCDVDDQHFYLKHADDKGDHLLVDNDFNLTAIVDWEWAHTDSSSFAFNSPIMLLPVAEFYDGANYIGEDEEFFAKTLESKGHPDLANIVRKGRVVHLFKFCCGYDLGDWEGFLGLFQGLRQALNSDGDLDWNAWRDKALDEYKHDKLLKELLRRCG
ncbi:hypothetical protein BDV18DRAFT_166963 [Aspergillus unguis]